MSYVAELINEKLINMHCESSNKKTFFETVNNVLLDFGFVEETFLEAIIKREEDYPTGLGLEKISIAIPHTDVVHIKKPFIFFNKVKKGNIKFIQMGTDKDVVYPEYVIVLGIKNPKEQVGLLSELMDLFSDEDFVSKIHECENEKQLLDLLSKKNN